MKTMKKIINISLILSVVGILGFATASEAQIRATATATITLTVLPAPGVTFASSQKSQTGVKADIGMTFDRTSNVVVHLNSTVPSGNSVTDFSRQSNTNTITTKQLSRSSSVKIEYLGS